MEAHPLEFPLLALARRQEVVLGPGEVIFVPVNTPHFVENLDDDPAAAWTCAYGGNIVDDSNLEDVLADLRLMEGRGDEDGAVDWDVRGSAASELDYVDMDTEFGMVEAHLTTEALCVPYSDLAGGVAANWSPEPADLAEETEEEEEMEEEEVDEEEEVRGAELEDAEDDDDDVSRSLRERMGEDGFVVMKGAVDTSAALCLRESVLAQLVLARENPTEGCFSKVRATPLRYDSECSLTHTLFLP
jgi:hypothetical protein